MRRELLMQVKTEGLIIKEQTVGESDRLVTVLTRDSGVLRAFARRAKSLKDSKSAATQLLCYSCLSVFKGREKYIIDDAEPIEVFFDLRRDIGALALAQYFCELSYLLVPEDTDSEEYLRLVLNSLHFLSKGTRPKRMLQAVTELRMLAIAGYMPDLVACADCAAYESDPMYFMPDSGIIRCKDCFQGTNEPYIALPPGVLMAMRHIVFSDFKKLYAFSLPEGALKVLTAATESYMVRTLHNVPRTLDFYKTFLD